MNSNKATYWAAGTGIALILLIALALIAENGGKSAATDLSPKNDAAQIGDSAGTGGATAAPAASPRETFAANTVRYTEYGFKPFVIEIRSGTAIRFVNETSKTMVVKSIERPDDFYPGFSQEGGPLGKNGVYAFTFIDKGAWAYQNLANPKDQGVVIVK